MRRGAVVVALALASIAAHAAGQVVLRGQEKPDGRRVVEVGPEGVRVEPAGADAGAGQLITWDRVRAVGGEHAMNAAAFAPAAEMLWRARTRIERGDYAGAEPLLEDLERRAGEAGAGGLAGASAAVVMDGLLRCRLARGAQAGAARAYLSLLAIASRADGASGGAGGGAGVIDPATGLVPALPPMFAAGEAALGEAAAAIQREHGAGAGGLAGVYALALKADAGQDARWSAGMSERIDQRAWVVVEIVRARTGDPAERVAARDALLRRLSTPELPGWLAAWCHVGIGRSLVREDDAKLRRRGVLHLLQAPARFGRAEGGGVLASLALREASDTMADLGEPDAAAALRVELSERYGAWPAARGVVGTPAARGASGE